MYSGKLAELLVAEWLQAHGADIQELEALGAACDIVALDTERARTHIEVKRIGRKNRQFLAEAEVLAGAGSGLFGGDPYATANYVKSRVAEAGLQLSDLPSPRAVIVVIEDLALDRVPLEWIFWNGPGYLEAGEEWNRFLESLEEAARTQVERIIREIDQILILQDSNFQLSLVDHIVRESPEAELLSRNSNPQNS